MSPTEAAQLLSILSAIDRREFDAPTAKAWSAVFRDTPYERVEQAAFRAIDAGVYVDVAAIKKQLGAMRSVFERDVRSAKARGLVSSDWPAGQPLTAVIEQQLRTAQAKDWSTSNDAPDEITGGPAAPAVARALSGR